MKGINELLECLKDSELASKFQGCKSIDELVAKAKELGFDVSVEEIEEATDLSDEALEAVAGGNDPFNIHKYTC